VGRLALSLALIAAGAAMFTASAWTGGSVKDGGTFRYGTNAYFPQIDPQLGYITTSWWLEYATALKLVNWPDRPDVSGTPLVLEAASSVAVSNRGKTYTFVIRKGLRFSDGSPVTARSFAYAIDRTANKQLASPGAPFITDPHGTNILGAKRVNDGHARHVSGVTAKGYRLVIRLRRPDGSFLSKLTMPFFQATSTKLPLDREAAGAYPSAGPYAFTKHVPNVETVLRRNRYYRGPRPRHLAGVDVHWNVGEQSGFQQVLNNQLDEGPLPASEVAGVATRFGVNKTRFWTKPQNCIGWLLFNNTRGLFKGNVPMRKAVNWALDRKAFKRQAGPYAASPWTHLLPPGSPGSIGARKLQPFSPGPNLTKAKRLAKGHFKDGKITVAYWNRGTIIPAQAHTVRDDLIRLGFKPENISMLPYYCELGPCLWNDPRWDIAAGGGWCTDFPDPYAILLTFLGANQYADFPSLASTRYTAKIRAAARLVGNRRLRAFGKLDLEIMNTVAPVAVTRTYNNRYLFSNRVDPRSLVYSGVYSDWSIPELALK
jgi:ABC-type oligopeptide transport system substrate-binding subunit